MKYVTIYTDGACSGNPGPGGWGALIIYESARKELCGCEDNTTNNRMELISAIKALEELKGSCIVVLYTDSKYLINGMTKWLSSWLENKWLNSDKKPVKNRELWEKLLKLSEVHKVSWYWIEGHSGDEFNEYVDKLARSQCKKR